MKILIGTTNPSKLYMFQEMLKGYDVELNSLNDLKITKEPEETGNTPEENARIKAAFYGQYAENVICLDSGMYFDELPMDDARQPGLHIRSPKGTRLDDDEMLSYYTELIHDLGGRVKAYYRNGYAIYHKGSVVSIMDKKEAARCRAFYMVDQPSKKRHPGWPLDSISLEFDGMTYFTDETSGPAKVMESEEVQRFIQENRERTRHFIENAFRLDSIG